MAKALLDQAQILEDSFYQTFKPQDAFFGTEDFARLLSDERDSLLDQEFYVLFQLSQRKGSIGFIQVNPQWTKRITVEAVYDKEGKIWSAEICEPIYEFPFDEYGMGIQDVRPFGSECGEFVRISSNQHWQLCFAAPNDMIFYSLEGCKITLYNFNGCAEKLDIRIVPSQSKLPLEQQYVPDGKASQIREMVLSRMLRDYAAKPGKLDMSNDGNANPQPNETGLVFDNLKTK